MKFKNNNQTYKLILQRKNFDTNGSFRKGLAMFTILDENDEETVGCISFGVSLLNAITSDEKNKKLIASEKSELLFVSLLPHLELNIEQLISKYENGSWCIAYLFDSQRETGFSEVDQIYYINLKNGFYKTIQNIMFKEGITNDKIQRKILDILYNHWEEDSITNILLEDLQIMIPVEFNALYRNLKALEEEKKIEILPSPSDNTKIISVKIKGEGRKEIEGRKDITSGGRIEYIMGNKIHASTSGNQSPIIIDSQHINLAFGDIISEIENESIDNSKELTAFVKELQVELNGKKNPEKVTGLLKQIGSISATVNQKILSHPLLAQLLATILASKMGLI